MLAEPVGAVRSAREVDDGRRGVAPTGTNVIEHVLEDDRGRDRLAPAR
jgi:hypothetical protein